MDGISDPLEVLMRLYHIGKPVTCQGIATFPALHIFLSINPKSVIERKILYVDFYAGMFIQPVLNKSQEIIP